MTQLVEAKNYVHALLATGPQPPRPGLPWLDLRRVEARREWEASGLPTVRQEPWRWTDLAPLAKTVFAAAPPVGTELSAAQRDAAHLPGVEAAELVFANGRLVAELSHAPPAPIKVAYLTQGSAAAEATFAELLGGQALPSHHGLIALNTANLAEAVLVEVPAGAVVPQPLHLIFHTSGGSLPSASYPRVLVKAGENSGVTLVVSFIGPDGQAYLTNAVTEIYAAAGARVELVKIQREGSAAYHIGSDYARLEKDVTFQSLALNQGGVLARNNVTVTLAGPGGTATLNGLALTTGQQHVDNHTLLDHAREHCASHELYKSLLAGRSTGTFTGKILVRPGAQKTDAKQTSKAVLLSGTATMNSQPQLEIYADDVKCTHGSTNGPLDDEQLFYLRARGLAYNAARAMLTRAFAADVIARVWHPALRSALETMITAQLHRLEQGGS